MDPELKSIKWSSANCDAKDDKRLKDTNGNYK
jgi:hypothetical protein